ncbi:MAG: phosphatase PAP2 family protein [Microbacteriaceae bacterium]|nr:phosphatase PAP2 family protein [Microbacteriaceae bacterium]
MTQIRAAVTLLVALIMGIFTYYLAVHTTLGQHSEELVRKGVAFNPRGSVFLNAISLELVLIMLGAACLVAWISGGFLRVLVILGGAGGAMFLSQCIKPVLPRPNLLQIDVSAAGQLAENSYPSGHVTAVAGISMALIVAVPAAVRGIMSVLAAITTSVAAAEVVRYGWHRPSDAIGAIMLVAVCFAIMFLIFGVRKDGGVSFIFRLIGRIAIFALFSIALLLRVWLFIDSNNDGLFLSFGVLFSAGCAFWCAQQIQRLSRG